MTNLHRQIRILYHLYESFNKNKLDNYSTLKQDEDLYYIHDDQFRPDLRYLIESDYIKSSSSNVLTISVKGVRTVQSAARKFMVYFRKNYANNEWIGAIDFWKDETYNFVTQVFFRIKTQTEVGDAFRKFLGSIESIERIENVNSNETYEMRSSDSDTLIDDIFVKIDGINRLFQRRFNYILFCPPLSLQSALHKATKERVTNFPQVVATVGLVINEICHKEIDTLLQSKLDGSINKIEALLKKNGISYDTNTIDVLRTLVRIRNLMPPTHSGGPELLEYLKKLDIPFPINDPHNAAFKILNAFDSCLIKMEEWFG
jgi:hypothetical protein